VFLEVPLFKAPFSSFSYPTELLTSPPGVRLLLLFFLTEALKYIFFVSPFFLFLDYSRVSNKDFFPFSSEKRFPPRLIRQPFFLDFFFFSSTFSFSLRGSDRGFFLYSSPYCLEEGRSFFSGELLFFSLQDVLLEPLPLRRNQRRILLVSPVSREDFSPFFFLLFLPPLDNPHPRGESVLFNASPPPLGNYSR